MIKSWLQQDKCADQKLTPLEVNIDWSCVLNQKFWAKQEMCSTSVTCSSSLWTQTWFQLWEVLDCERQHPLSVFPLWEKKKVLLKILNLTCWWFGLARLEDIHQFSFEWLHPACEVFNKLSSARRGCILQHLPCFGNKSKI